MAKKKKKQKTIIDDIAPVVETGGKTLLAGLNYLGQGIMKGAEGIMDAGLQLGTSKANPYYWFNPDKLKEHQAISSEIVKKDSTKELVEKTLGGGKDFNKKVLDEGSLIKEDNLGGQVVQSIGQMLPGIALGAGTAGKLKEGISLGTMGVQSYGSGIEQAYQQGKDRSTANKYGLMNAAVETATEKMFAGVGAVFGKGAFDDVVKDKLVGKISNKLTQKLVGLGLDATGEGIEEIVSEFAQPYILKLSGMSDKSLKELKDEQKMDDFVNSFAAGALSALVMGGTARAIENNTLSNNEHKLIDEITNRKATEQNTNKFIENEIQNRINNSDFELNTSQKEQLRKNIENELANGSIQAENILSNKDISGIRKSVKNDLKNGKISTSEITDILGNTDFSNDRYISSIFNEENQKTKSFDIDTTNIQNEKVRNLYESAKNKINNTKTSHSFADAMAQLVEKTGRRYLFTNNQELNKRGLNIENKTVNGLMQTLKNGEQVVLINIDSKQALNTVLGHETTHLLEGTTEYQDLQNSIIEYAKSKGDYEGRLADLTKRYDGIENVDINSELTADLVGDYLFTDEKFINDLAINKPTLATKIKNVIDNLVKTFKGTNEEPRLKELQEKFNKALDNVGNNTNTETKYSTIGEKGAKNLSKNSNERQYKYLSENLKVAKDMYDNNADLETNNKNTKQSTKWFKTKYGDWGTLISDKDAKITKNLEPNKTYKLGDILEHKLLYQAYPELKKLKVNTTDIDTTGGYASIQQLPANTIINDIKLRNSDLNKKDFRKTLLHEVNHYIEHKEKYNKDSRGANSKQVGKEAYLNNLGEIISDETKINADLTQDELDAIILPEQATKNPSYDNIKDKLMESNRKDLVKGSVNNALQDLEVPIQNKIKNSKVANKQNDKFRGIREELDNSSFSNNKYSISENTGKLQENGKDITLEVSDLGNKGTLMALHNISEDKLNGVLELNGIPVPSIAITNPEKVNHKSYGDGTLIFDKSTIDPTNKLNEVYDRDVWSPRFPNIDREINNSKVDEAANKIGISDSSLQSLAEEYNDAENLAYRLSRDTDIVENYLDNNNIKYTNEDNVRKLAEENGIMDYLNEQLKDIYGKKGIYNGESYIDDNGNRRKFWQMHDEYTLENIVKNLTNQDTKSSETSIIGPGFGNIQANMANQFNSIDDIKANESKIMNSDEANIEIQKIVDEFNNESNELAQLYGEKFDPFWDMDSINYQLQELSKSKNINAESFYKIANKYNPTLAKADENLVNKIVDTMNKLKNIPTDYFEAKPQRAVGLDEIGVALIPNTWSNETKQALNDKGVNYIEYDPNIEGDRQRIENMYDEFKFSLSNTKEEIAPTGDYKVYGEDIKQVQNSIQDLSNQINELKDELAPIKYSVDPYAEFGKSIENDEGYNNYIENLVNEQSNIAPYNQKAPQTYEDFLYDREATKDVRELEQKQQNRIEREPQTKTTREKISDAWDAFQSHFVNRNQQIDKISKITGNNEIKYKGDRVNNIANEISGDVFMAQTDNYGNAIGKSLDAPFERARELGLSDYFDNYLKHQSNIERHARGKGSAVVDAETSKKYVKAYETKYPELKEMAKDVYTYNQNLLNNAVENGLITEDFKNQLNAMYGKYVPFYEQNNSEPNTDTSIEEIYAYTPIRSAKGGTDGNLLDIEQAMMKQTYSWKNSIAKNDLYKEIGESLQDKADVYVGSDPTTFNNTLYADENGKYMTYFLNGEEQAVRISNDLYKELSRDLENQVKNLEKKYSVITKPLQKLSDIRGKFLTSYNPSFILRNPIKDVQDALINTKNLKGYLSNYSSSFTDSKRANKLNEYASKIEQLTGESINNINPDELTGKVKKLYDKYQDGLIWNRFITSYGNNAVELQYGGDTIIDMSKKNNKFLQKIKDVNNFMELMSRYPEFKQTIENGGSFTEALYNAREVTTNFGRGGTITKAMNRNGATFLNASVQGMDKFIRNFSGQNGSRAFVGAVARAIEIGMVPTIINHLLNAGDDDYEELKDYIKDNYYLFKTGDGEFIRIPKGRMTAVLGSAARRTMEYAGGENEAYEGYLDEVNSQIGINDPEENNVFAPLIQAFGSKNGKAWYGDDLVPKRLQNKPVTEQYDESTDALSIKIGQTLGISPYKVNYVLDQYSGGLGDIVLPMMTKKTTNGAESVADYVTAPIKDAFEVDSTTDNKYPGQIYDLSEKLQTQANGSKATDFEKVQSKYINAVAHDMNELYAKKREIQNSDMPNKEKLVEVKAIQDEINALAKKGYDNYQEATMSDTYALIGNKEFTKNTKDEWKSLSKSDAEKLEGATPDEKSEYFYVKNQITNIKDDYKDATSNEDKISKKREIIDSILASDLDDNLMSKIYSSYYSRKASENIYNSGGSMQNFLEYEYDTADFEKEREKINYLYNSGFDNTTKKAIYENKFENMEDEKVSDYEVAINYGVDINSWLKLKSQVFEAEVAANGKKISGTKKAKIMSCIQSLKLNVLQKALLMKLSYSSYKAYDQQIYEYLEKENMPISEKEKYAEQIGLIKRG